MKEIKIDSMFEARILVAPAQLLASHERGMLLEADLTEALKAGNCVNMLRGLFPSRLDSILAGVLVWLCEGARPLTAWDGIDAFRTLRLDAAIRTLKKEYRWPIESISVPKRRPDGTTFYVTGYKLPQAFIDYAFLNWTVRSWIIMVMLAQVRKRARDGDKAAARAFYRLTTGYHSLDDFFSLYCR